MRRLALLALLAGVVAGCSADPDPVASVTTAPATVTVISDSPHHVECVNVERAYTAWKWQPSAYLLSYEWGVRRLREDGDNFYSDLKGYTDAPAKALALAAAEYNLELSLVSMELIVNTPTQEHITRLTDAVIAVGNKFDALMTETCGRN